MDGFAAEQGKLECMKLEEDEESVLHGAATPRNDIKEAVDGGGEECIAGGTGTCSTTGTFNTSAEFACLRRRSAFFSRDLLPFLLRLPSILYQYVAILSSAMPQGNLSHTISLL